MSTVFGIARESLKRSATRIGGGAVGVRTPCATEIWSRVSAICCFRLGGVVPLGRDHDEPAGDEREQNPARDQSATLASVRQLAHPVS